jgi:hypothetical protein
VIAALLLVQASSDVSSAAVREVARQECKGEDRDEIVVCGRRGRSPYRLPPPPSQFDPFGETKSVMHERLAPTWEGESGTGSCGPVGPGGWTGCLVKGWREGREQTAWGKNIPTRKY